MNIVWKQQIIWKVSGHILLSVFLAEDKGNLEGLLAFAEFCNVDYMVPLLALQGSGNNIYARVLTLVLSKPCNFISAISETV